MDNSTADHAGTQAPHEEHLSEAVVPDPAGLGDVEEHTEDNEFFDDSEHEIHGPDRNPAACHEESCRDAAARGDSWIGPWCSVEPDGHAHFHHVNELHDKVRIDREREFADLAAAYRQNPTNFATAWHYLVNHPIFLRPLVHHMTARTYGELSESERQEVDSADEFDYSDGLRDMWTHVGFDDSDTTRIWLEHGPHMWACDVAPSEHKHWPALGHSSHDPRLDVRADTYENAIVALAANVASFYGDDRSLVEVWPLP